MFLPAHKIVRRIVLGLMFFLAGTAYCSCDSYDPDPYDDTPPVVTVEYNYVVPNQVSIRPQSHIKSKLSLYSGNKAAALVNQPVMRESQFIYSPGQAPPQWHVPLRR